MPAACICWAGDGRREGISRVFGQNEGYDPQRDAWEQYAPMPTPRHGLGAAAIGDAI